MAEKEIKKQITYKEFFEESKKRPYVQALVDQCVLSAVKTVVRAKKVFPDKTFDVGKLVLSGIATLAEIKGIIMTHPEEITAEYLAEVLNSYKRTPIFERRLLND